MKTLDHDLIMNNKFPVASAAVLRHYLWYRTKSRRARRIMGIPSKMRTITSKLRWEPDSSTGFTTVNTEEDPKYSAVLSS